MRSTDDVLKRVGLLSTWKPSVNWGTGAVRAVQEEWVFI